MARIKNTISRSGARKGIKAPRKTIVAKKVIARRSISDKTVKTHRRSRQGVVADREIRRMQKDTNCVIPRNPFARLVRAVAQEYGSAEIRFQGQALQALQEAAEAVLIRCLSDAQLLAQHAHRVTIMEKDIALYITITRPTWALSMK